MSNETIRMKELIRLLNKAGKAYYQENREIMSNFEYDSLYDELTELEKETGLVLADSPTISVGYEVLAELPKERHESPMLSLDKTKEVGALAEFLKDKKGLLSWKLDGLTIVLTYREGKLVKAVTRGNGEIGEVITNNARMFQNIPLTISYKKELILRGEAIIKYSDFQKINEEIDDVEAKYKNPRNLCSGAVRQLNNRITKERNVHFYAFSLVKAEGKDFAGSHENQFLWIKELGFDIVEYQVVYAKTIEEKVAYFAERIRQFDIPSDGLVLLIDDIDYGISLGRTAKFPRDAMAFKWQDEKAQTTLKEIEWSPSRTGLINPVAIFEPVELEGTTVSRASVHNLSIMEELQLGIGDTIEVYKANMIIPQIADNITRSGNVQIPVTCPVCGQDTQVRNSNGIRYLYCVNEECLVKKLKSFMLLVSRDALNIERLSGATLEKFIDKGFIKEYADIFKLSRFKEEIIQMDGLGEKSYYNLEKGIEKARNTTLVRVLYGLGIPNVGLSNAKVICEYFNFDFQSLKNADKEQLSGVGGIGEIIAQSFIDYFKDKEKLRHIENLLEQLNLQNETERVQEQIFADLTFVITGNLELFSNRKELKEYIENRGGKVTGTVSKNTDYLINNDSTSGSSKNKKARELQIPVITEKEFIEGKF